MAGGQSGAGAVGEFVFSLGGALVVGFVLGVLGPCGGGGDTAPMDEANHECEVAWVAANDNDPETVPAGVIEELWCQDHNTAMRTAQVQDDQQRVQEAAR